MSRLIKHSFVFLWMLAALLPDAASAQDSLALQNLDHLYDFPFIPAEKTIATSGNHLYVGHESPWRGPGILILNTATSPAQILATIPMEERVNKLTTFGNYLLVTSNQALRVYGTHRPNALNLLTAYPGTEGIRFLESRVSGSIIVSLVERATSQSYELQLISLEDFSHPELLSSVPLPGNPGGLSVINDLLVFEIEDETSLIDISDPAEPVIFGSFESNDPVNSTLLAAGNAQNGLNLYYHIQRPNALDQILTIGLNNPEQPDTIGAAQVRRDLTPTLPSHLFGDLLLVPTSLGMTDIYQLEEDANPSYTASLQGLLNEIVDSNNGVFLINYLESGIRHYDFTTPTNPVELAPTEGRELRPLAFDPTRNLMFVHDGELMRTVRLHEEGSFEEVHVSPISIRQHVLVAGERLYHWSSSDTIFVVDTHAMELPAELTPWTPRVPVYPGDLIPSSDGGRLVKIEASGEMKIYSTLLHPPQRIASLRIVGEPPPRSVALHGDLLAVLLPDSEVRFYDIVHPFGPQLQSSLELPFEELNHVSWQENFLLVRSRDILLKVDVSDEAEPALIGEMPLPNHGTCLSGPGWASVESQQITTFFDMESPFPAPHASILLGEDGSPFAGTHDFIITSSAHSLSLYQLARFRAGMDGLHAPLPSMFSIESIYPNPFNGQATIKLYVPRSGMVKIDLFNLLGQRVYSDQFQAKQAGTVTKDLTLEAMAGGAYFLRLEGPHSEVATRRITLLK